MRDVVVDVAGGKLHRGGLDENKRLYTNEECNIDQAARKVVMMIPPVKRDGSVQLPLGDLCETCWKPAVFTSYEEHPSKK